MTEQEIAASFSARAKQAGWDVIPECQFWDLVLVRQRGNKKIVVGVEVKKKFSRPAFIQAANRGGVHYKIVAATGDIRSSYPIRWGIAYGCIPVYLLSIEPENWFFPRIHFRRSRHWPKDIWLPAFRPSLPASVPAPIRLTQRAQAELDFERTLRAGGGVATMDELRAVSGRWLEEFVARWTSRTSGGRLILVEHPSLPSSTLSRRFGPDARRYTGKETEGEAVLRLLKSGKRLL